MHRLPRLCQAVAALFIRDVCNAHFLQSAIAVMLRRLHVVARVLKGVAAMSVRVKSVPELVLRPAVPEDAADILQLIKGPHSRSCSGHVLDYSHLAPQFID